MSILGKLKARDLSSFSSLPGYEQREPGNTGSSTLSSFNSFISYREGKTGSVSERATGRETERPGYELNERNEESPDPADWAGEYEDELPPAPDYGDESEHDAWLSGTPAAELWPAS